MQDVDRADAEDMELLGELQAEHDDMLAALKRARHDAGLSEEDMAEMLGWSVEAVRKFEGPFSDPHMSTVRRYAIAVGALIRYTVRHADDPAPSPD